MALLAFSAAYPVFRPTYAKFKTRGSQVLKTAQFIEGGLKV